MSSFGIDSKEMYISLLSFSITFTLAKYLENDSSFYRYFPFTVSNEKSHSKRQRRNMSSYGIGSKEMPISLLRLSVTFILTKYLENGSSFHRCFQFIFRNELTLLPVIICLFPDRSLGLGAHPCDQEGRSGQGRPEVNVPTGG